MNTIFLKKLWLLFFALWLTGTAHAAWNTPDNGNPVIPGYFADPSIMYDSLTNCFYLYSTTDGVWIDYSADPQVAYSSDFVHWKFKPLTLPKEWPHGSLRTPTAIRHPANGRYYLVYSIGNNTKNGPYIALSTSPFGPWTSATSGGSPLYTSDDMWGYGDWCDAQFFVDSTAVYLTFGGAGSCGILKLAFSSEGLVSIDNTDQRFSDGTLHNYKKLTGLDKYLEGSCMFKKDGIYFLTYSNDACQNYNVHYAVASSPVGPFTYKDKIIVQRDTNNAILGPGHNSILQFGSDCFIVYHRQHFPYVDVKRQTCVDQILVTGDYISTGVQTQAGLWQNCASALGSLIAGARTADSADLAFGKPVVASSESDYKGGTGHGELFDAQPSFYAARYAVDRNNGTRWAPSSLPAYCIVDLEAEYRIGRCETTFEYVMRTYNYRIEYLTAAEVVNLDAAVTSAAWHLFADRSANSENVSPIIDTNTVSARYIKVTLLSADLPKTSLEVETILETDHADRVSIFEFKVFAKDTMSTKVTKIKKGWGFNNSPAGVLTCNSHKAGTGSVKVFDVKGCRVYSAEIMIPSGGYSLSISKLPLVPGIYFGILTTPDGANYKTAGCVK